MALNYTSDKLKHLKMFYDILNLFFFFLVEICIIFWLSYPTPQLSMHIKASSAYLKATVREQHRI